MSDQPTSSQVLKDLCALARAAGVDTGTVHVPAKLLTILTAEDHIVFMALHPGIKIEPILAAS